MKKFYIIGAIIAAVIIIVGINISINPDMFQGVVSGASRYNRPTCTDSDGGIDVFEKGTVTYGRRSYTDYCWLRRWSNYILEYYCDRNQMRRKFKVCPEGCEDGACKQAVQPSITVISPNGGETWRVGDNYNITWTSIGLGSSKIEIYLGGGTADDDIVIVSHVPASAGTYSWTIPTQLSGQSIVESDLKLYIRSEDNPAIYDYNDSYFSIVEAITAGALTVSKDASSPSSDIVIGGELYTLAVFRLSANNVEDLDLDQITISVSGGNYINTLYLYKGGIMSYDTLGSAPGATISTIVFSDGTLTIPANGFKLITVKAKFLPVDGTIIKNNSLIRASLDTFNALKTTGLNSGQTVGSGTQTVAQPANGNLMYLFKSRPYFSLNSGSPSGNLVPSSNTLLAIFNVRAHSGGDISFENADGNTLTLMLAAGMKDVDSNSMDLTLKDGYGNNLARNSIIITASAIAASSKFTFSTNSFSIPVGTTKQLYVYGDTTNFEDSGDYIRVWLDDKPDHIDWGIDGSGSYNYGDIIFRGDISGYTLVKP